MCFPKCLRHKSLCSGCMKQKGLEMGGWGWAVDIMTDEKVTLMEVGIDDCDYNTEWTQS